MAYVDQYALSEDAVFQQRVKVAMVTAALQIVGEAQGEMHGRNHKRRHDLGVRILNDPDALVAQFSLAAATNAAISAGSLDSDIQFQINAQFGDFAGVGDCG